MRLLLATCLLLVSSTVTLAAKPAAATATAKAPSAQVLADKHLPTAARLNRPTRYGFKDGGKVVTITPGAVTIESTWVARGTRFVSTLTQTASGERTVSRTSTGIRSGKQTTREVRANGDVHVTRQTPMDLPAGAAAQGVSGRIVTATVNGQPLPDPRRQVAQAWKALAAPR